MSQGKTSFKFVVNADMALVETVIRNWLTANKFTYDPKSGLNYFGFNDPMLKGKRGFEYYINGNEVTILAYIGTYKKPQALEGFVGAVMKQNYRNELAPLFEEIKKLENAEGSVAAAASADAQQASPSQPPVHDDSLNTFMAENEKKQGTLVIIGFVMSLVGLLLSCFGFTYGAILLVLEFYFAIQGLKTKKKGFAIATLAIAGVSILVFIGNIVLYVLLA